MRVVVLTRGCAVMYASKVVERAPVAELFGAPKHPYTHGLFASKLTPETKRGERLVSIDGMVPSPLRFPTGCKFHPRCPYQEERCQSEEPELREFATDHIARCHLIEEISYS